jgi:hypothetical protein
VAAVPRLSRLFIRAALLHLLLGITFGALLLAHKGVPFLPALWRLLPAHVEFLLVGWTIQLALGVSFWILPRFWQPPRRGNERFAWLALILLNGGVWLVAVAALLSWPARWLLVGRLLEAAAALAYALHLWPRVVSREG